MSISECKKKAETEFICPHSMFLVQDGEAKVSCSLLERECSPERCEQWPWMGPLKEWLAGTDAYLIAGKEWAGREYICCIAVFRLVDGEPHVLCNGHSECDPVGRCGHTVLYGHRVLRRFLEGQK